MRRPPGILEPLRDEPGPARPLSVDEMDALVEATLDRADFAVAVERVRPVRIRRSWRAAAVLVLALGGAAAAGTHIVTSHLEIGPVTITEHELPGRRSLPVVEPLPRREVPPAQERTRTQRDLLVEANQLRQHHKWSRAERLYSTIVRTYPGSDEAYAASIAAASLRLEHLDDADGALELYLSAWKARRDGPLAEEALYGVAGTYRALGRWGAERRALGLFLKRFPESSMREQVEHRLDELDGMEP